MNDLILERKTMDVMIVWRELAKIHTGNEGQTEDRETVIVSYRSHGHKLPNEALVFENATELADCIHAHYGTVPVPRHCEEIIERIKQAMKSSPSRNVNTKAALEDNQFVAYRGSKTFLVRLPKQLMVGWQVI